LQNRDYFARQILDLSDKIGSAEGKLTSAGFASTSTTKKKDQFVHDGPLTKLVRDANKISSEQMHGLISQVIKDVVFTMK